MNRIQPIADLRQPVRQWRMLFGVLALVLASCYGKGSGPESSRHQPIGLPDSANIWKELFPGDHHFDQNRRLIRNVIRNGQETKLHTAIGPAFRYKSGKEDRAVVMLFSYDFTQGAAPDCAACFPSMDVARFNWKAGAWRRESLVENWKYSSGSWGEPASVSMKRTGNKPTLGIHRDQASADSRTDSVVYYSLETLEPFDPSQTVH